MKKIVIYFLLNIKCFLSMNINPILQGEKKIAHNTSLEDERLKIIEIINKFFANLYNLQWDQYLFYNTPKIREFHFTVKDMQYKSEGLIYNVIMNYLNRDIKDNLTIRINFYFNTENLDSLKEKCQKFEYIFLNYSSENPILKKTHNDYIFNSFNLNKMINSITENPDYINKLIDEMLTDEKHKNIMNQNLPLGSELSNHEESQKISLSNKTKYAIGIIITLILLITLLIYVFYEKVFQDETKKKKNNTNINSDIMKNIGINNNKFIPAH